MAKLAKPKAKAAPKTPKKPTSRSKTGNAECSAAASTWQLSLRGKATATAETYQTLAKCRALASGQRKADAYGRTGKLSDQGAAALKGRLQKRFDSGLITAKSRQERLEMLLKQRGERKAAKPAVPTVQASESPMRYKEFIASGRTDAEWDAYAAEQNNRFRLRAAKKVRDEWREGKSVSGQTVLGWLDNKNVRVSDDMRRFLQHDKTLVSTSGIEGIDAKKYATKVQNLIGQYIGRGTQQRRQQAEFLLKQRKERAKPSPPKGVQRVLKGTQTPTTLNSGNYAQEVKRRVDERLASGDSLSVNTMTRTTPLTRKEHAASIQAKGSSLYIASGARKDALTGSTLDNLAGQVGLPPRYMVPDQRGTESRKKLAEAKWGERKKAREMLIRGSAARKDRAAFLRDARASRPITPGQRQRALSIADKVTGRTQAPAPSPARYSLGGQLAPGRGTEERKKVAGIVRGLRTGNAETAAATLKSAGVVAIPSKFDSGKVAIKERDLWNAYTPRQAAYRVLATRTLAGAQRKKRHMLRLGWVTP